MSEQPQLKVAVLTLFPDMFNALEHSITGRALTKGLLKLILINPRDFSLDKHKVVDDRPFGGGPGMVMMAAPLQAAIAAAKKVLPQAKVIYLSPQGKTITQQDLQAQGNAELILLSGRYEGLDQRLIDSEVDEEWSIGDYVLSGGELPAMVVIDALTRLIPGALGDDLSAQHDSFSHGLLDHPHYTRPRDFQGLTVPDVLLNGDHHAITRWRLKQSLGQTWLKRPDLLEKRELNPEERDLLNEFMTELEGKNRE